MNEIPFITINQWAKPINCQARDEFVFVRMTDCWTAQKHQAASRKSAFESEPLFQSLYPLWSFADQTLGTLNVQIFLNFEQNLFCDLIEFGIPDLSDEKYQLYLVIYNT